MADPNYNSMEEYLKSIGANNTSYGGNRFLATTPSGTPVTSGLNWGAAPSGGAFLAQNNPTDFAAFQADGSGVTGPMAGAGDAADSWFDMKGKGGMAIGAAQIGLGAYNSWMGAKNQKFMQNYYGKQQSMQLADFGNNAKMTNLKLNDRIATQLSNRGVTDPGAVKQQSADYMNKWKVKTTI